MFKKLSKVFLSLFTVVIFFAFISPSQADAAKFVNGNYTLGREEILHDDLFVAGNTVEINGIIDGDVYIAAENISITGTISDDLYMAGSTATISGNIYGDLVSVGSSTTFTGSVAENAYIIGGSISSTGSVVDDLVLIGGQILADGEVEEDLIAVGEEVTVKSSVEEDLIAFAAGLSISEADVSGEIYQEKGTFHLQDLDFMSKPDSSWWKILSTTLISAISMYLVGAFLIYIMPVKTVSIVKNATSNGNEFIKSFALGFTLIFIVSVPVSLLLSITIVGLPIVAILMALITFLMIYAKLWVEIGIGEKILKAMKYEKSSPYTSLLVGRCLSVVIGLIPIVGWIYNILLTLTGAGAFFRMKYDLMSPSKTKNPSTKQKKATKK